MAVCMSSSITPPTKYDVFLSFRGEDTRSSFTSHLQKALRDKHVHTFIDYKLKGGDEISPSLSRAIEESQISVVIFSKGYASSRWCLEELVKILECRRTYGQIVIPVFYEIDPSVVRNQTGSFAEAFADHEESFKESLDKVQRWKDALREAANLSGSDSRVIKPESVLVEHIVEDVVKRLNDMSSSDHNSNLIGIDSRIKKIESLLCNESNYVRSIGLWGIGGIGKTTLASAVFDKISSQFEGSYLIQNIREESEQSCGLNHLRRELLSAILWNVKIGTSVIGRAFTRNRVGRKKLFIVFDDVSSFWQIEYMIGGLDCLGSRSRVIITTRDKQMLKNCRVDQIYEVKELFYPDALKLFSRYAFRHNHPTIDFAELSNKAMRYARGVPLALKILGSSLLDKKKEVWESAMHKLERILDMDIQKVLKISYDGLNDDQKNIFLDIACFFKGRDVNLVKQFLDASGFFTEIGISGLIDKSLITISHSTIMMHDLLQALGREIVRQESIEDPGKRSRLWHHEDIYHVLTKNMGTEKIVGMSLDMSKTRHMHLSPHAFARMQKLRFLEFYSSCYGENDNKVYVFQGLESSFVELRYFHWHGCPFKSLQSNFHPQNLVILDMPHSSIEQLWDGVQHLVKLKKVDLSFSKHLTSFPELSGVQNLESLILEGCTSLLEIPSSIQFLTKLNVLNLRGCKSLRGLPNCICLKSLRKLILSRCSNLKTLPEISCNVEELFLDETAIEELPSSIEYLCSLVELDLRSCSKLKSLPRSVCNWKSMKHLYLSGCSKLDKLPDDIGTLGCLKELYAEGIAIREVPVSIVGLNSLDILSFKRCRGQENSGLLLPPGLSGLHSLRTLDLTDCGLMKIPDSLGDLSSLQRLYLGKKNFKSIPKSIIKLSNLRYLDITYCKRLQFLPRLPFMYIDAYDCTSLEVLSCLLFLDLFVPITNPSIKVVFINCFKLDRNVLRDVVEEALPRMKRAATLWKKKYYDKGSAVPPFATTICFPGSEIPQWFNFQSTGSFITVELPRDWLNKNFVGFALCSVVAFRNHQIDGRGFRVLCQCKLKSEDGYLRVAKGILDSGTGGRLGHIGSDHVIMGFDFYIYPNNIGESCYFNEVSFQFYLYSTDSKPIECCKVSKCGIHLMYA
ncbi:hypothetical protein ACOSP7_009033 [Xanthoceras sorbifolium]